MKIEHKGRTIGELDVEDDELLFTKHVDPKKHKMNAFNAYAIQESAFREYLQGEKGTVRIIETDMKERTLESSINKWNQYGFVRDMGAGEQRFLMIGKMKQTNEEEQEELPF